MLKKQEPYRDPGQDFYLEKYKDRIVKNMKSQAARLGFKLVKAEE